MGIPTESPYPQNPEILNTYTPTPFVFSLDASARFDCKYSIMIRREKFKNRIKQIGLHSVNFKRRLYRYGIFRVFDAFPLNLASTQKNPHRIRTDPWGFITVPIPIPYPYPWESPWEYPYPRQPWESVSISLCLSFILSVCLSFCHSADLCLNS